jgi:hypothetical protein
MNWETAICEEFDQRHHNLSQYSQFGLTISRLRSRQAWLSAECAITATISGLSWAISKLRRPPVKSGHNPKSVTGFPPL